MIEKNYKEKYYQIVADYLWERCETDTYLKDKMASVEMKDVFNYIKKQAKKQAKNGCACIEDSKVYEMAVHFILEGGNVEEDEIEENCEECENEKYVPQAEKVKTKPVVDAKPKKKDKMEGQLTLFDL